MRRHPGNTDPTQTPAYLPDWPTTWPDTMDQARRMIDDMQPHPRLRRAYRTANNIAVLAIAIWILVRLPPAIVIPLVLAGASIGARRDGRRDR